MVCIIFRYESQVQVSYPLELPGHRVANFQNVQTGPYDFNNIYNPGSPLVTYVIPGLYVVKVSWSSLIFMKDRIYDM